MQLKQSVQYELCREFAEYVQVCNTLYILKDVCISLYYRYIYIYIYIYIWLFKYAMWLFISQRENKHKLCKCKLPCKLLTLPE